jgi:hypothetical protein
VNNGQLCTLAEFEAIMKAAINPAATAPETYQ